MNWDYIIVGAGSSGCALAHELLDGGSSKTVLVLEAGGSDRSPFIRFPAGAIRAVFSHDWGYWSQPDPSRNGKSERWISGQVLGGSSSVNSTVFVRGAAQDFDRWAAGAGRAVGEGHSATAGWSAVKVMPIFREMETSDQSGPLRGQTGPLSVRTIRRPHALTQAFVDSAAASGYPLNHDYNGATQEGVAYAQLSQRHGLRCSAADAFLRPLLGKKPNLKLMLNAKVHKVEIADGRATAVSFMKGGILRREVGRQIIVCAGALNSPKLLMLSGIGDAQELKRLDIDPVVDLPGVGRNLRDHPLAKLVYRSRIPSYNLTGGLLQKIRFAAQFLTTREGPISNIFESVAFLKTSPAEAVPDVQLHFTPLGYLNTAAGGIALAPYPSVIVLLNKSHPLSRGQIRLASSDPDAAPLIECRILEAEADINTLVRGIEMVRRILQTPPIADLLGEETMPGAAVKGDTEIKAYLRNNSQQVAHHFSGTCRMGTDADSVVSPELRVHGLDSLWVADASIMPQLISGNTNAACMMIGKKLGRHLNSSRH